MYFKFPAGMVYDKKIEPKYRFNCLYLLVAAYRKQTNKSERNKQQRVPVILQRETKKNENRVAFNEIFSNYAIYGPNLH